MWRKMLRLGLLTLATLNPPAFLLAQNPARGIKFERISIEQGLSQSSVTCMLQDSKGFMWFGTTDGLNQYDGYRFTVYKHDAENPNSLSDNWVVSIYEDRSGVLWIGTGGGGLNKFDRAKEKFTHYKNDPNDPNSLSHNDVESIYEDPDEVGSVLWIGTYGGGLNRFDRAKEQFIHYKNDANDPNSVSDNDVWAIYEDRSGVLWIGTGGGGLNKFDRAKEKFTHYKNDPNDSNSLSHNEILSIYEDPDGVGNVLWIGTLGGGLNKFDRAKEQFIHYKNDPNDPNSVSDNDVWAIYEDPDEIGSVLWVGTDGGLNKFDRAKEKFTHYKNDSNDSNSLSDNYVRAIYEDRSSVLWIGTFAGGLNKFDRAKQRFTHYNYDPNDPNSLSDNLVLSIYEDRSGVLWIGTSGGLNKFDRAKEKFTHYKNDPNDLSSLSYNIVMPIYEDPDEVGSVLWIGTFGGGLNKFDRAKENFTHYKNDLNDLNSLSNNYVLSIYEDRAGVLWIGTFGGGLNKFDRAEEQFTHYKNAPNNPNSLSHNNVISIYEDRSSVLWIGTFGGGLNKFDRAKEQFTHYKNIPNDPNSLSHNDVESIYEGRSGVLWIGTYGGGLNKFDRAKEKFTHYTEKDGLPNDAIYGILEDDHGYLWLSTNKGLSKFNPQTETFKNYDHLDGLQSNEFSTGAYHKSRSSGELFFGGINGFNAFYPDSIKDNPYLPPVVITAFKRYNTGIAEGMVIEEKGISQKEAIELSYKDNILAIEFAALNYRNTFKNQYAYKLEGFTDNWIYLGTKHDVTFTNLDPGEYTLRVKGSNNDGVWNEAGASMQIIITPPFWQTWWFRLAAALAVIGFLAALYNYRVSKLLEIERTRLRIARDLHDDVGSSLSSIALTAEMLQKELATNGLANRQLARVYETAKKLSHNLKEIVWAIDPHRDKFDDLLLHIKETAEELLGQKGITYTFDLPPEELPQSLKMEFRRNLFLIYKEMLHNVVKHAEATKVEIALTRTNGVLQLQVADNGKGLGEEKAGNGSGLKSMRARAGELNGKLEIESQPERGTKVRLSVKIT